MLSVGIFQGFSFRTADSARFKGNKLEKSRRSCTCKFSMGLSTKSCPAHGSMVALGSCQACCNPCHGLTGQMDCIRPLQRKYAWIEIFEHLANVC